MRDVHPVLPVLQTEHPPPERLAVWAFLGNCSQISSPSLVNSNGVRVNREEERERGGCGQTHHDLNSTRRERREESRSPQQQQQRRSPAFSLHGLVG